MVNFRLRGALNITSAGGLQGDFTFRWRQIGCPGEYNERIIEFY